MIIKTKKVYYCEYCKKHGLSAGAMGLHEKHCTANPDRICRMCDRTESIQSLIDKFKKKMSYDKEIDRSFDIEIESFKNVKQPKVEDILDSVNGCPMCALTIIRGTKLYEHPYQINFNFKDLVEKYWVEKNEEEHKRDMEDLRYG